MCDYIETNENQPCELCRVEQNQFCAICGQCFKETQNVISKLMDILEILQDIWG